MIWCKLQCILEVQKSKLLPFWDCFRTFFYITNCFWKKKNKSLFKFFATPPQCIMYVVFSFCQKKKISFIIVTLINVSRCWIVENWEISLLQDFDNTFSVFYLKKRAEHRFFILDILLKIGQESTHHSVKSQTLSRENRSIQKWQQASST